MSWTIQEGDSRHVLRELADGSVDSVVCDPPYELGFMGKSWDRSGIACSVELWTEVLRVLKPGGHLLAFGGTRTYHRMTCAIEDAGFEIRDSLHWMYGTGFPKSLNVGGGRGTALKPGHEPIVLARKPLEGTVAANVQKWGTGGLNIDGCRLQSADAQTTARTNSGGKGNGGVFGDSVTYDSESSPLGRWPANVLLDEDAAAELDAQTEGKLHSAGKARDGSTAVVANSYGATSFQLPVDRNMRRLGDSGGASRFFYTAKCPGTERNLGCDKLPRKTAGEATDRTDGSAGLNSPRAGAGRTAGAKNIHPTVKPVDVMRWLCRLVTPPGGLILDPFTGSGSTGVAAVMEGFRFHGVELQPEYAAIARARIEAADGTESIEDARAGQLSLLATGR